MLTMLERAAWVGIIGAAWLLAVFALCAALASSDRLEGPK